MIYLRLFLCFLQVGMFSIGGGYAAMPLIQNQVVDSAHWLTMAEFTDLLTIAEMTPGPIAVNSATFVGIRIAGPLGAVVATAGCILPSCILVSLLFWVYHKYKNLSALQNVLASLRPAVVALIAGAGLTIAKMVLWNGGAMTLGNTQWLGFVLIVAAFALLRALKWNPILVMLLCGISSLGIGIVTGAV